MRSQPTFLKAGFIYTDVQKKRNKVPRNKSTQIRSRSRLWCVKNGPPRHHGTMAPRWGRRHLSPHSRSLLETVWRLMPDQRAVWITVRKRFLKCLKQSCRSIRRLEMRGRPLRGLSCVSPVVQTLWHSSEMVDRRQCSLFETSAWLIPASSMPWALYLSSRVNLAMFSICRLQCLHLIEFYGLPISIVQIRVK